MALDQDKAKSSLFGSIGKTNASEKHGLQEGVLNSRTSEERKFKSSEAGNLRTSETYSRPKWEKMEKTTVFLAPGQKDWLECIAKKIMRSRALSQGTKRERITLNTVLRCLIDYVMEKIGEDLEADAASEEELKEALKNSIAYQLNNKGQESL